MTDHFEELRNVGLWVMAPASRHTVDTAAPVRRFPRFRRPHFLSTVIRPVWKDSHV